MLVLALSVSTLVSCEEDEEALLPALSHITADDFAGTVSGKGWRYVESHEIRDGRICSKRDYWDGLIGGAPVNYAFTGDSITEFIYVDAYPIKGYRSRKYTFDEATNGLMSGGDEVMRIVSVSESELRIIKHEASTADGEPIYVYAVYRAMTPWELAECKAGYPYDLDTFDDDYPRLPEQQRLTPGDFASLAVGRGWTCAEDLETADKSGFRIVSLSPDEMRVVSRQHDYAAGRTVRLYCVYRRMTADELSGKFTTDSLNVKLLADFNDK